MQLSSFALAVDGSNDDTSTGKMNPLLSACLTRSAKLCVHKFWICVYLLPQVLKESFQEWMKLSIHHIGWENCIGMGLDNTSVNIGYRHSMKREFCKKIPLFI